MSNKNLNTNFVIQWITSTCAPESIKTIPLGLGLIHIISNETNTKSVYVIETTYEDYYVSDSKDLIKAKVLQKCNLKESFELICELLELTIITK